MVEEGTHQIDEKTDIKVCIRARPRLSYEIKQEYFEVVHADNPHFHYLEPKHGFKSGATIDPQKFRVDHAFGPADDNDKVYSEIAYPLIDLSLKGGLSTIFAYGQTGSGKTFTMQGIQQRLAHDLFKRQRGDMLEPDGSSRLQLFVSFIQIIGNYADDLLNLENKVGILENKLGLVEITGASEVEIFKGEDFLRLNETAAANRTTTSTFKNDTSSRSHAVCKIRIKDNYLPHIGDGEFYLIDLAGSESTADSQFHDKELIKQTQFINKSLMALKDCVRNKALSALDDDLSVHIPYRNSKLTLLLKDSFELKAKKHCKTVIFANVAPSLSDMAMTKNTLRFIAPLKVTAKKKVNKADLEPRLENPASWTNEMLRAWVKENLKDRTDPDRFCPFETGKQILSIPESEFIHRLITINPHMGPAAASFYYDRLRKLLYDFRTKNKYGFKKEYDKQVRAAKAEKRAIWAKEDEEQRLKEEAEKNAQMANLENTEKGEQVQVAENVGNPE